MRSPTEHTDNMNKGIKPLLAFNGRKEQTERMKPLDGIFRALIIKELPHYQGAFTRIHLQTQIRNKNIPMLDVYIYWFPLP
jgi:hypothetical protein